MCLKNLIPGISLVMFSFSFRDQHLIEQGHNDAQTVILSEYIVLREILWMFFTPTTTYLFREENKKFTVKPNISISSLSKVM
jgi:hypothetical protein